LLQSGEILTPYNETRGKIMGDRAVFGFKSDGHTLFLYSHWGGDEQLATMQEAIREASTRWGDPEYATRIAVSHIIGEQWRSGTGYGLSINTFSEPDYPYAYVVDWDSGTVETIDTWQSLFGSAPKRKWTLTEFLALVHQEA
jgi:hypothetical protein